MKNILKNFWVVLTRFKVASILNLIGLAVAFAVFSVIMMQSYWELSYNKHFANYESTFRLETDFMDEGNFGVNISRPMGEAIGASSASIKAYACSWGSVGVSNINVDAAGGGSADLQVAFTYASADFPKIFGFERLSGDLTRFAEPHSAIIDGATAERLFAGIDPLGQQIRTEDDTLSVVGVYKTMPKNSSFSNGIYTNIGDMFLDDRSEWGFYYYYQLHSPKNAPAAKNDILRAVNDYFGTENENKVEAKNMVLLPVADIYFEGGESNDYKGNYALTTLLMTIAFLIIGIAVINYINFFMALVPIRVRAVNINKIFGAPLRALRWNIIAEAVGMVAIAFIASLFLVELCSNSAISGFVECSLAIEDNWLVMALTALIALAVGLIGGVYPAFYITRFAPLVGLKGAFGRSRSGQRLRTVLVGFQYIISIALIIASLFVALQTTFMQGHDMGFSRDRILNVRVGGKIASQPAAFLDLLKQNPAIEDVAYSDNNIVNIGMGWGREVAGEEVFFTSLPVSWNYPQFMNIKLVAGRYFIKEDASKTNGTIILNETAARKYKMKVGDFIEGHSEDPAEVVGIVADFNFRSMKYAVEPIILYEFGSAGWRIPSVASIRIAPTAELEPVMASIAATIKKLNPDFTDDMIKIEPLDNKIERLYEKEHKLNSIIILFSIVAIIISLVGVFGLVVFEVQYRRREIALRKVHGASWQSIPAMINRKFVVITIISALIAIPAAYYGVWVWLQGFAYKVPLYWWVAAVAVASVLLITVIIVTVQTVKAATENPIKSLMSE